MEALIHHFKLVTEGFRVPPGEAYVPIEGPRGELGCFVVADGSAKPARVHMRDPSFVNLQALREMCVGGYIADMITNLAMLDPILGRDRPVSKFDHLRGDPRLAQPARRPRSGKARGSSADPAAIPELARGRGARRSCGRRSSTTCRCTRTTARRCCPALRAAQASTAGSRREAMLQVAAVMRVTPAYLESIASFYDMLELEPVGRHTIYVCTNISCQLRGAARRARGASRGDRRAASNGSSPDGEFHLRSFECLGACDIAPMASIEGHYRGPLTPEDARAIAEHLRAGGRAEDVLPEQALRRRLRRAARREVQEP